MSYIVVDIESDGPLLGTNSMVCFSFWYIKIINCIFVTLKKK